VNHGYFFKSARANHAARGDSRYQRRNDDGTFAEGDKVSRSQPDDKAHNAKTTAKPGQGDKGDHKK
jgi:hypothetical protein